jgi:hypothetical protein
MLAAGEWLGLDRKSTANHRISRSDTFARMKTRSDASPDPAGDRSRRATGFESSSPTPSAPVTTCQGHAHDKALSCEIPQPQKFRLRPIRAT